MGKEEFRNILHRKLSYKSYQDAKPPSTIEVPGYKKKKIWQRIGLQSFILYNKFCSMSSSKHIHNQACIGLHCIC